MRDTVVALDAQRRSDHIVKDIRRVLCGNRLDLNRNLRSTLREIGILDRSDKTDRISRENLYRGTARKLLSGIVPDVSPISREMPLEIVSRWILDTVPVNDPNPRDEIKRRIINNDRVAKYLSTLIELIKGQVIDLEIPINKRYIYSEVSGIGQIED